MRRLRLVVFAVLASLLLATTPTAVSAQSSELVLGSQHTTTSDFEQARELTNLTAVNNQVILTGDTTTIDDVEDGDITEYGGSTGFYEANSSHALAGSHSIRGQTDGSSPTSIASTSGLPAYPSPGDTFRVRFQSENIFESGVSSSFFGIGWAAQSESAFPNGYETHITGGGEFRLYERNTSGPVLVNSTTISLSDDTEYELGVDWQESGQMTVTVYEDTTGNGEFSTTVATLSMTDTTFTSGGISIGLNSDGPNRVAFVDEWRITSTPADRGVYRSPYHQVDNAEQAAVNISELSNASATITIEDGDANQLAQTSVTSPANHTVSLSSASQTNSSLLVNVTVLNQSTNGEPAFTLSDEAIQFTNHAPEIDNSSANPTGDLSESEVTLQVDVTDSEFDTAQGESVDVEFFVDGSTIGTDTLASNRTAAVTTNITQSGNHTWHAEATDDYGLTTTSQTFDIAVPGNLTIREETGDHEKITSASLTVTFYEDESENPRIVERTAPGGVVNLTGLPTSTAFSVTVDAPGYHNRTVLLDDLFDQQTVFLLNKNETSIQNTFLVSDRTNQFPSDSSELILQKAINRSTYNGTPEGFSWTNIAGDDLGADEAYTADLEEGGRYRVKVENDEGDTRILGAYTAKDSGTVELTIGSIEYNIEPDDETYQWDASYQTQTGSAAIKFNYSDPEDTTTDIRVTIYEYGNASNEIYNQTHPGPFGTLSITQPLTQTQANNSWVVAFEATQGGDTISGNSVVGRSTIGPGIPVPQKWKAAFSLSFLFIIGGILGSINPEGGALVLALISGIFWYLAWLPAAIGGGAIVASISLAGFFMYTSTTEVI